ncbi:hypothetical protein [Nannocystis sp.]|uniref:hypothetical protein n=1 Tax=Nannocystis sp. TaxID=1962667 RepID=UPI0025D764F7|nr:hypothetical protein [Nannocystis sp.]MBK7827894.1 hypothetical protein [Nannocystis sp.]
MRLRFLLLLAALPACSDDYEYKPDPGYGELGVGVFLYECPTSGDPYCANGSPAAEFPQAFALGGRIHLKYNWKDDSEHFSDPLPQLQSASPTLLARESDGFTALATGYAAVLAVTGNSEIVDLRHLHIREIDALRVSNIGDTLPLSELHLEAGAETLLQARALDVDDVTLGGVLGHAWTTADPDILSITAGADSGQVRLQGGLAGDTTLTLTLGELSVAIAVTIEPPEDGTSTGSTDSTSTGSTDSTGDTDATGTGTGTDSSTGTSTDTGTSTGTTGGAL